MTWVDAVWIAAAVLLVGFTIVFNVVRKLQGKSSCGCGGTCPAVDKEHAAGGGCGGNCTGCSRHQTK